MRDAGEKVGLANLPYLILRNRMSKPPRLTKTAEEIHRNFRHAFDGLLLSSQSYDKGYKGEAARLAATVYILVHDHGKRTVSLLTQLRRRNVEFVNTGQPINPKNLLTEMPLTMTRLAPDGMEYVPRLGELPMPHRDPMLRFRTWWEMIVMRDNRRRTLSRKNIVFHMRHSEGGGHVDPTIDEVFAGIQRANTMGWVFTNKEGVFVPEYGPEYATMRQIAWEVEQTVRRHCRDLISN